MDGDDANERDIGKIFEDGAAIDEAMANAAAEAAFRHKQRGIPLVVWENGRVRLIPPEEIEAPSAEEMARLFATLKTGKR